MCFFRNFHWSIVDLQCLLVSAMQPSDSVIHMKWSLFQIFFPLDDLRVLNQAPSAAEWVLSSHSFYAQQCVYANPNPQSLSPSAHPGSHTFLYICDSLCVSKVTCTVSRGICLAVPRNAFFSSFLCSPDPGQPARRSHRRCSWWRTSDVLESRRHVGKAP